MTKTKKQLRAEAVERLKMLDEYGGGSFEYAILGSDKMAWRYMDKRDALIDLLTGDDSTTQEVELTTESLSDEADSREQLEADVREVCWGRNIYRFDAQKRYLKEHGLGVRQDIVTTNYEGHVLVNVIMHLLDRQAAITERETTKRHELFCETCEAESDKQIAELKAERDELKGQVFTLKCECEDLENELHKLTAERERYRSKFGKCLDYADAIHALMDDEGMA